MRKVAKVLSFKTIPQLYSKHDKRLDPANGIQLAYSGDLVVVVAFVVALAKRFFCSKF